MNCYLHDVEQPTASGTQLNRVESISAVARRRAVACVVQDDDDASGILEHNLPTISFQSTKSDDCILMMHDKRAAVGLEHGNNGLASGDHQHQGNVCELPLFCKALDDSWSHLDEGESTTSRRVLEKSESSSAMP